MGQTIENWYNERVDKLQGGKSMKRTLCLFSALLILSMAMSACSVVKNLISPQSTPASGDLLWQDDFSKTPNGWGTMGRTGGEIGFEYEGLTIKVNTANFMFWTVNGQKFQDAKIDVDAVLLEGPADDNFGVICRFVDNDNFYAFVISHDGYFGIFKMKDGVISAGTDNASLEYSDAIRKGGVVNHISVNCQGDVLSLTVNDTLLSQIQDDSFSEGQIGLIASAYNDPGVKVLFDNLKVYQP
jgi:hypothetical protein